MKKNTEITDRRVLPTVALFCATSFIAVAAIFNFETVVIMHNDDTIQLKTMHYVSDTDILNMAGVSVDGTQIADISNAGNIKTIVVEDTFPVNITVDGAELQVNTLTESVSNILAKASITVGENDIINISQEEVLSQETQIEIIRVTTENVTTETTIPYKTVKRSSSKLDFGDTKILTEGKDGKIVVTTQKVLHDGILITENIINEEIMLAATNEVVEYGSFNVNRGVTNRDGLLTTASGQKFAYSKIIDVQASAYSTEGWTSKNTASGTVARVGSIAVDPRVIPLGSKLYITSANGSWVYGVAVAEDTGGAIKGNKIDLFFNTQRECINFGRQQAKVYVLS